MINSKKIPVLLAGLLLILFSSCKKDFMNNVNKGLLDDATQWSSEGNADLYLNDIYNNLSNKWNTPENLDNFTDDNDAGFYWKSYSWKQGIVGPSINGGTPMDQENANPSDYASWASAYNKIRKCNMYIQQVKKYSANFSSDYSKKRIDEVRFLRAYFYSELWMSLGGLPVITDVLNSSDTSTLYRPRNSFEETLNFITTQLDSVVADNVLQVKYSQGNADAGRATLGAAQMLKSWVLLYAASPAFNASVPAVGSNPGKVAGYGNYDLQRYATAAASFKFFLDTYGEGHPYDLFPSDSTLWYEANKYNSEVIWDRQIVATIMGSSYEQYGGPVWILGAYYTWGNYDPTQELIDQFSMANGKLITDASSGYDPQHPYVNREKRFYQWIVYDGAPYDMNWMPRPDTIYTRIDKVHPYKNQIDFGTDDVGNTAYYFKKKLNPLVRPGGGPVSGENFIYYRYAEILLGYAEAQNEAAGPDLTVYNAVNRIRARSALPELPLGLSQSDMRLAIQRERRVELCFENKRFYDIIRWKTADQVMNQDLHGMKIVNSSPSDNSGSWVYTPVELNHPHVFTKKMYLNPIPQAVIDQNSKIIQNPGY